MKIISYNIHRGTDKTKKDTLDEIIKYLKKQDSDIICLQEVVESVYKKLKEGLKLDGCFVENVKSQHYGTCIFSKHKIIDKNHVLLPSEKEQRGFQHIKIKTKNNKSINIINAHLGLGNEEREKQIKEILGFINKNLKESIGNVICGDFNQKNVQVKNYRDVAISLKKDTLPTFSDKRIDYCFFNDNLAEQSYKVEKVNMSDHYPIIIDFQV